MKRMPLRFGLLGFLAFVGTLLLNLILPAVSQAHWADLAAAEMIVGKADVQMTLTFPTGLMTFADDNRDGQLNPTEIQTHQPELHQFVQQQIQLTDTENRRAALTIQPLQGNQKPPSALIAPKTHSTLVLNYRWLTPIRGLNVNYGLFLPGVPTASCLTTILQNGSFKTHVFTPTQTHLALTPGLPGLTTGQGILAIAGALLWGAIHSLSPGHGKTIVGAYLVGERATAKHAIFLAATTTITHTIGVFALGAITLFAARYILPETLYPWLSLISGLMVVSIGLNLLINRLKHPTHAHPHGHSHPHPHEHSHNHPHPHPHEHTHPPIHPHPHPHEHTHLPPGTDGSPVTWRSLLTLGISGGLVPCPAALVLLLSAIALGNVVWGMVLVLAFSLGLAGVLTALGLILVCAKQLFKQVPTQMRIPRILPALSAVGITLIGFGISTKALWQIGVGN
jgi:ABC-type nickel/cobalt efflux system permease component RcnA